MNEATELKCTCGQTLLEVRGEPILVSECLCDSCRTAAARLAALPGARSLLTPYGATPCAEYRKDRVRIISGADHLKQFRLFETSGSRRVVATCCNTPVFLEMNGAHWLSLYLYLWPDVTRPKAQMRTMVGDLADASGLPNDIPNLTSHTARFYAKLFGAWVAMGFRNPKFEIKGKIDA